MRKIGLFFFLLMGAMPTQSYGCECVASGSPAQELEKFAAVFTAKVEKFTPKKPYGNDMLLKINKRWKGDVGESLTVNMHRDGCGYYGMEEGKEYLIYASLTLDKHAPSRYHISQCSRTKLLEKGLIETRYLDAAVAKEDSSAIDGQLPALLADERKDVNRRIEAANLLQEKLYRKETVTIDEEQAVAAFLKAVQSPEDELRLRVAQLLNIARFAVREDVKTALLALLKEDNQAIVNAAVYSLSAARKADDAVFEAMAALLSRQLSKQMDDERLRQRSLAAIGVSLAKIANKDAQKKQVVELLLQAIEQVDEPYDKTSLIQHLGFQKVFAHHTAPALLKILQSSQHYHVKQYTLAALADVGAKEMLAEIKPYIHDENCYVIKQSMEAMFALDKANFAAFFSQEVTPILQKHFDRCQFEFIWGLQTLGSAAKTLKPYLEKRYATLAEHSWMKGQLKNLLAAME